MIIQINQAGMVSLRPGPLDRVQLFEIITNSLKTTYLANFLLKFFF